MLYSRDGQQYIAIGKKGKAEGELYYPTDVQVTDDLIWVADAYNNRVQAFTKDGVFAKAIGADLKINAATGIFISAEEVFVTDFENDRVLVLDMDGNLLQEINEGIEKPTDILVNQGLLYVANYRSGKLTILHRDGL